MRCFIRTDTTYEMNLKVNFFIEQKSIKTIFMDIFELTCYFNEILNWFLCVSAKFHTLVLMLNACTDVTHLK